MIKRKIIILFIAIFLIGPTAISIVGSERLRYYFSFNRENAALFKKEREAHQRLWKVIPSLSRLWESSESSEEWKKLRQNCLDQFHLKQKFNEALLLSCHPLVMSCYAQEVNAHSEKYDFRFKTIGVHLTPYYRYITKENSNHLVETESGYLFTLVDKKTDLSLDVVFSDRCREVYLEQSTYLYKDQSFDNIGRHLYIDSYLVTNYDINDWINYGNAKNLEVSKPNDWFRPATTLNKNQMQDYCAFKGRSILKAEWYHAASAWPPDVQKDRLVPSPYAYYWAKIKDWLL